jgi:ABC-type cobalamin transport system permease subunit
MKSNSWIRPEYRRLFIGVVSLIICSAIAALVCALTIDMDTGQLWYASCGCCTWFMIGFIGVAYGIRYVNIKEIKLRENEKQ